MVLNSKQKLQWWGDWGLYEGRSHGWCNDGLKMHSTAVLVQLLRIKVAKKEDLAQHACACQSCIFHLVLQIMTWC